MAIELGDCILRFLSDTTNLDQGVAKVEQIPAKMAPVAAAIAAADAVTKNLGESMAVGQQGAVKMGEVMTLAGEKARLSMYQARGEVMLLGEETGIRLPRHVAAFVAELPGVGSALTAAFEATAVLFLLQALVKGAEELSNWIANTFIFTDAMKAMDQTLKDFNTEILRHNAEMAKLRVTYDELGLGAAAKLKYELDQLTASIRAQEAALVDLKKQTTLVQDPDSLSFWGKVTLTLKGVADMYLHTGFVAKQLADQFEADEAAKALKVQQAEDKIAEAREQAAIKEKQLREQEESDFVKAEQARISSEKLRAEGILFVRKALALATVAFNGEASIKNLLIDQQYQEGSYEIALKDMHAKLDLLKQQGAQTRDQQIVLNAEITKLTSDHNAELLNRATKFKNDFNLILSEAGKLPGTSRSLASIVLGTDFQDKFQQAERDAEALGITLTAGLAPGIEAARKAYDGLIAAELRGAASAMDVRNAHIAEIKAEIEYATAIGATEKQIEKLNLELRKLEDESNHLKSHIRGNMTNEIRAYDEELAKSGSRSAAWGAAIGTGISEAAAAYATGAETISQALAKIAVAQIQAIAQMADAKGTEQLAESFGSWPDVAAMAEHAAAAALWFSLGAGISYGASTLAGGSGGGSSASRTAASKVPVSAASDAGTVGNVAANPTQTVNVQKLGGGGLISDKTLAMIGDSINGAGSAREAVLPLDNPAALRAIAGALAPHIAAHMSANGGGGDTHIHHNWNVNGLVSDDTLHGLVRKMNRKVQNGQLHVKSTTTTRVNRKSI